MERVDEAVAEDAGRVPLNRVRVVARFPPPLSALVFLSYSPKNILLIFLGFSKIFQILSTKFSKKSLLFSDKLGVKICTHLVRPNNRLRINTGKLVWRRKFTLVLSKWLTYQSLSRERASTRL